MKYIKLFMLLAVVMPFFTSCSDDDDVNTAECTVGFEETEVITSEYVEGYLNIPIVVTGKRNGPIHLTVKAEGTGENPAIEGTHFTVTDKTLNLNADTLSNSTINVEVKIIDDTEMNADRQFTLTITDASGADITAGQTTVTIMNNDGFYKSLFGEWTLTATSMYSGNISCDVILSGTEDENSPEYENILTATTTNFLGIGETLTFSWAYNFDSLTRAGQVGWLCDQSTIATLSGGLEMFLGIDNGDGSISLGYFIGDWALSPEGEPANTIEFPSSLDLLYYGPDGRLSLYDMYTNIKLTRK